ncbi:CopG family transcriptional regulator [Heyndrickxia oleronia]|uniref:CopG family transcriptional regulator n=1 Tax=Heyndrickxia oleronia TaxID=38875 RepID=UPI00242E43AF|nr:CopG family transcriptional regulator [Heyndrickxia oleronia]MCI1593430.1 CopG family transcriptional regulator [Heyndrickxia oleronia]MCI1615158.1 CopG family transcriptional regulator [Heyndrickxia oleronia]MCI1763366.1 CopG family transcriptional regulator [Heyndrickxia oleronia]
MAETEKITINMNVVDLGKVDLLVEQGFYSNRTDFIKTAIRNQLTTHSDEVNQMIVNKSFVIGICRYNRKSLQEIIQNNVKLDIKVIGMLILEEDNDTDLALKTINSIKVYGVLKIKNYNLKKTIQQFM